MSVNITFLGAAGTVTGSKYLVEGAGKQILVDAGLFQGPREWKEKNWAKPAFDVDAIDAVLITHEHLDHIGMLPRYVRLGLKSPVFLNSACVSLAKLILADSGRIQEEYTEYAIKKGYSRHEKPEALYDSADVEQALKLFRPIQSGSWIELFPKVRAKWGYMGHILGACSITLEIEDRVITFSGDIGRYSVPLLRDPEPVEFGDVLLIESTYGDRLHPQQTSSDLLADIVNRTVARKGVVVIPSFAVGRAQQILFDLRNLTQAKRIPTVPVIIDSPMASEATQIYQDAAMEYDPAVREIMLAGQNPFNPGKLGFTKNRDDSIRLNSIDEPMIIISASGMLYGGRILHHLRHRITDPRNTILFVGFQPKGGKGDWILHGDKTVRLFGQNYPIRAEIAEISGYSAHADRDELLKWCHDSRGKPSQTFVVHGEPESALSFSKYLTSKLGWSAQVAGYLDRQGI